MSEKLNQIILNEQNINDINQYLGEMPFKHALPLVEYLGKIAAEQGFAAIEQEEKQD